MWSIETLAAVRSTLAFQVQPSLPDHRRGKLRDNEVGVVATITRGFLSWRFGPILTDMEPTSREEMEGALAALSEGRRRWGTYSVGRRIALLDELREGMVAVGDRWVSACCEAKGIERGSHGEAEEWMYLAVVMRYLRLLGASLVDIQKRGRPRIPGGTREVAPGQIAATVYPTGRLDRMIFAGVSAEIWMPPGVTATEMEATQAPAYRARRKAAIALLLGAGNVSPVIVYPGRWTDKELRFQAVALASMFVDNAGCNCLTPRVVVLHRGWPQRRDFLDALAEVLSSTPTRKAYYQPRGSTTVRGLG